MQAVVGGGAADANAAEREQCPVRAPREALGLPAAVAWPAGPERPAEPAAADRSDVARDDRQLGRALRLRGGRERPAVGVEQRPREREARAGRRRKEDAPPARAPSRFGDECARVRRGTNDSVQNDAIMSSTMFPVKANDRCG
jgi:hypothetical protein